MRLAAVVAASLCLLAAACGTSTRASASTCGDQVIADWTDNQQLDKKYPAHCYREALGSLPTDLQDYSPIGDDIRAALNAALQHGGGAGGGGGSAAAAARKSTADQEIAAKGPIRSAAGAFGSNSASSIPLPLVILAALATLLVAAGLAPSVVRRVRAYRPAPRPAPQGDRT